MTMIICSEVTGAPQASHAPWNEVKEKGGGAYIPCIYKVHPEPNCESHVWNVLSKVAGEKPGLIKVEVGL